MAARCRLKPRVPERIVREETKNLLKAARQTMRGGIVKELGIELGASSTRYLLCDVRWRGRAV